MYTSFNTNSNTTTAVVVPKLDLQYLQHEPSPRVQPLSSSLLKSGGGRRSKTRGGVADPLSSSARKGTGRQKYPLATSRFETSSGGKTARLVDSPAGGGGLPLVSPSSSLYNSNSSSSFGAVVPVIVMTADPPPHCAAASQPLDNNDMRARAVPLPRRETHVRLQTLLANRQQQKLVVIGGGGEDEEHRQIDEKKSSEHAILSGEFGIPGDVPTHDETTPVSSSSDNHSSTSTHIHNDDDNGHIPLLPPIPIQKEQQGPVFMIADISTTTPILTSSTSAWLPPSTSPGFSTLQPPTPGLALQEDPVGRLLLSHLPQSSSSQNVWKCGDLMDCLAKGGRLVRKCWVNSRAARGGMLSTSLLSDTSSNLQGSVRMVSCKLINLSRHSSTIISCRSQRVQLSYKSRRRGGGLLYPLFPPVTALVKKIILPRMPWKPGCYMVVDTDKGMVRLVPPCVSELAVWALSLSTMMNMAATGGGVEMREMSVAETEWNENGVLFQC